MAKARKILKHAKAVASIRTVTNTMAMVASARYRKAYDKLVAARPYISQLTEIAGNLVGACEDLDHPLLREQEKIRRSAMIVLTSNSGLCGPYNSNVLHVAVDRIRKLSSDGCDIELYAVGKKGIHYLNYQKCRIDRSYTNFNYIPDFAAVAAIGEEFISAFSAGRISSLDAVYTQYLSSGHQEPAILRILPMARPVAKDKSRTIFEFIPSPREILQTLLPAVVRLRLYQCFLDASVSEQFSRVRAMKAATENADEMIHNLTVRYNRTRQAQITTELAEIMGGAAGVK